MIVIVLGYDKSGRVQRVKLDLVDLADKMTDPAAKKQLQDADKLRPKDKPTVAADRMRVP